MAHGNVSGRRVGGIVSVAAAVALLPGPVAAPPGASAATPPGGTVSTDPISKADLLSGARPEGLTHNDRFAPGARAGRAPAFHGKLRLAGTAMGVLSDAADGTVTNPVGGKDTTFFPDVSLRFFTAGRHLVPTSQAVIRNGSRAGTRSYWDVLVQPGRVWHRPGDGRWHRASFPFALVNSIEGETHNGIALFLYRGQRVSPVRFQVVQQTSPFNVPEYFSAWGTSAATYEPGVSRLPALRREFRAAQHDQLPVRPWRALRRFADREALRAYNTYPDVVQSAAVVDGHLYRTQCPTAAGPLPYCDSVRYGVWSVAKSAVLNVALLRLAQKYGTDVLDRRIARYVPGAAARRGWRDVTFGDLANMASGHGAAGDGTCYLCDYDRWYLAPTAAEKTAEALDYPRFVEPGTLHNYRDQDAWLLFVAESNLLKAHEGPDADLWDMLRREVYRPIGIWAAPTNRTLEGRGPGMPLGIFGHYPTLDDLAKIAALYEHRGAWGGEQVLDRTLVNRLLPRATMPPGLPADDRAERVYLYNWHVMRIQPSATCTRYVPQMRGWGGNTVTLLPGHRTLIRIRNNWVGDSDDPQTTLNRLAADIAPVCG